MQGALASAVDTAVRGGATWRSEEQTAEAGGAEQGDEGGAEAGSEAESETGAVGSGRDWHEGPLRIGGQGILSIGRDHDDARASLRCPVDRARVIADRARAMVWVPTVLGGTWGT